MVFLIGRLGRFLKLRLSCLVFLTTKENTYADALRKKEKEEKEKEEKMAKRKKAPKGYHYMPNGKLMKNSAHGKKKKKSKR